MRREVRLMRTITRNKKVKMDTKWLYWKTLNIIHWLSKLLVVRYTLEY